MSFFEDIIINLGQEGMYFFFKRLGMLAKWICYSGKKPFTEIKNEN